MHPIRGKRSFRALLGTPAALVIFAALAAFAASAAWSSFKEYRIAAVARGAAEARSTQLESEEKRIKNQASVGGARRTEEEIREKLKMAKPGEEIIILVDENPPKNQEEILPNERWWQKLFGWVIKK